MSIGVKMSDEDIAKLNKLMRNLEERYIQMGTPMRPPTHPLARVYGMAAGPISSGDVVEIIISDGKTIVKSTDPECLDKFFGTAKKTDDQNEKRTTINP